MRAAGEKNLRRPRTIHDFCTIIRSDTTLRDRPTSAENALLLLLLLLWLLLWLLLLLLLLLLC